HFLWLPLFTTGAITYQVNNGPYKRRHASAFNSADYLLPLPLDGVPHLLLESPDGIGQILSCLFNLSNRGIVKVHFNHPLESAFSANFAGPYHEAGRGLSIRENVEL